jgi:hypothetical protein
MNQMPSTHADIRPGVHEIFHVLRAPNFNYRSYYNPPLDPTPTLKQLNPVKANTHFLPF